MTLLDALGTSPQTKAQLAKRLDIPTREVEALIQQHRISGVAIWSDSEGYRYCRDAAETFAMFERLRHRVRSQSATAWALRATARRLAKAEHQRPQWPAWAS